MTFSRKFGFNSPWKRLPILMSPCKILCLGNEYKPWKITKWPSWIWKLEWSSWSRLESWEISHSYIFYFSGGRSRSTDLIFRHLTVANSLVISLSLEEFETIAAFGLKHFLSDFGCKVFSTFTEWTRCIFGSTCLLSVFQAMTVSPRNSRWAKLKRKSPIVHWLLQYPVLVSPHASKKHCTYICDWKME